MKHMANGTQRIMPFVMCFHMGISIHRLQLQTHGSSNPRSVCPDGHPPYDKLGLGGSIIVLLHGYRDSDGLHPILAICVLSEFSLQKRQHKAKPLPLARFQETLPPAAAYRRMFVWTCFMKFSRSNLRYVMVFVSLSCQML